MDIRELTGDYFADEADLEGSLDLPVLGRLKSEPRFYQRQDGLMGLAPDPRLSERLYRFIRAESRAIWVVGLGLGHGGEELPVAVGIAERAAAADVVPILFAGPEKERPSGMSEAGLRPVVSGRFGTALETLFPDGCGAQTSGIQGVLRIWPCSDREAATVEPAGLVVASHWSTEALRPPPDGVGGVVLVVPYRDEPARAIIEQVNELRSSYYPLLGIVAASAPGVDISRVTHEVGGLDAAVAADQGGAMDTGANAKDEAAGAGAARVDPKASSAEGMPVEQRDAASAGDSQARQAQTPDESHEQVSADRPWSHSFGPDGTAGTAKRLGGSRFRLPWWGYAVLLIVVATAGFVAIRMRAVQGTRESAGTALDQSILRAEAASDSRVTGGRPDRAPMEGTVTDEEPRGPVAGEATAAGGTAAVPAIPAESDIEVAESAAPAAPAGPQPAGTGSAFEIPGMGAAQGPPFALLCGSFREADRAASEATRLRSLGMEARVLTLHIPGKGIWNRVVVGSWTQREQAREQARRAVREDWVRSAMIVPADGYGPPLLPLVDQSSLD